MNFLTYLSSYFWIVVIIAFVILLIVIILKRKKKEKFPVDIERRKSFINYGINQDLDDEPIKVKVRQEVNKINPPIKEEPIKKKENKFWKILSIILVLILLSSLGIFCYGLTNDKFKSLSTCEPIVNSTCEKQDCNCPNITLPSCPECNLSCGNTTIINWLGNSS